MKRIISLGLAALTLLLGGCATVIRSDVTAFNEWPADLPNKSYVFEHMAAQSNDLEYRNYENLVGAELQRLGFIPAGDTAPQLKVALRYDIAARDVRVVEPVVADPMWYGPYGPYGWGRPGFYSPFYDPFWYAPQVVGQREYNYQLFQRRLNIAITRAGNGQKLYDVTVTSEGKMNSLPAVMPYLIRSAFTDFPGKSGATHQVKLKVEDQK
ncbi:protein of unknown function [Collimonas sp. OK242]|jgi:hypothetical protein|uniref:DUF4136 domain-containing protein n=1 Tax=Collimonas sp. OK242 TaxID=1798195 RepID=UPI000894AE26|nr:DUF4136 domain-containing protein [Collimonas sp. OK242]SDY60589.1 protein of unknown function [Collimonas sp. OK242]